MTREMINLKRLVIGKSRRLYGTLRRGSETIEKAEREWEKKQKGDENIFHYTGALPSRMDDDKLHNSAEKIFLRTRKIHKQIGIEDCR